jgi:O-antigen/teichoic acid export membrane protein
MLKKAIKNKVLIYLFTRYLTYGIQFISSIIIASKLGPYYFGIWGFILLIINYLRIIDFGISSATNILLVQNKDDNIKNSNYVTNSLFLISILGLIITFFALYYYFFGFSLFDKYKVENLLYPVCLIAILTHFNVLFMNLYRFKNSLFHISFFQSIIPILTFIFLFFAKGEMLIWILIIAYIVGNIASLLLFIWGGKNIPLGRVNLIDSKQIINKGMYLFIYSISFYLIIVSIKTLISIYYSVEEFGIFTFSFTLSNSVLLFLQAMSFVIFPKVIDKLKNTDNGAVINLINELRVNYVTLAFGLIFIFNTVSPPLLNLFPKYKDASVSLGLLSLTLVLYTNSFGYGSYLMAQNKEKINALISFISLVINIFVGIILITVFKVSYKYVIISTILAYTVYTYLCVFFGKKFMNLNDGFFKNFNDCFPIRLFVPYVVSILLILTSFNFLLLIPLILFIFLNKKEIKIIYNRIIQTINKPNSINL